MESKSAAKEGMPQKATQPKQQKRTLKILLYFSY